MKVTVIGGNSGTGELVVRDAFAAGHDVTCLSRSGMKEERSGIRDVHGDAADPAILQATLVGADAVVVTVGSSKGASRHRADVTRAVVDVMKELGVGRLIVQSSLGAGDSGELMAKPAQMLAKTVLAKALADHDAQEDVVFKSGLNWTIVRPGGLTDKPATGKTVAQETQEGRPMKGMIPRADVAAYIVQILGDEGTYGKALGLGTE